MALRARAKTVARFRADMARLLGCIGALSSEQRQSPIYSDWSVREVAVHIAAWDRLLAQSVDELLAGQTPTLMKDASRSAEAQFNARIVAEGSGTSLSEALAGLHQAHESLLTRIEALTDEEWRRASPYGGEHRLIAGATERR